VVSASVVLKEGKEITGASLQSPYDPDATYGHKGKGYEAQLAETCVEGNPYQVITAVKLTAANGSDQHALLPIVEDLAKRDLAPEVLLADTGYGSGENIAASASYGVVLLAPVQDPHGPDVPDAWERPEGAPAATPPTTEAAPAGPMGLDAFTFNTEYSEVTACPAGFAPRTNEVTEAVRPYRATFDGKSCTTCPLADRCPTRVQANTGGDRVLDFRDVRAATETRQREQQTPAFKKDYRLRSGVESTNAELKGRHGAGDLRVRGKARVELAMTLKAMALNAKRAVQHHVETLRKELAGPASAELSPA
jgi:IS5 family transposase